MPGRYADQLQVGEVIEHPIRRTVTDADNMWFCAITFNPAPVHIDRHYCAGTEFGRPLVNGVLTLGLVVGLSVHDTTMGTLIANLGFDQVRFGAPVFAGDTIRARTTVMEKRDSRSRPEAAVVTFRHEGLNQDGVTVVTCVRTALMRKSAD